MNPPNKVTQVVRTLRKLIQKDRKVKATNDGWGIQKRFDFTKEKQNRNAD